MKVYIVHPSEEKIGKDPTQDPVVFADKEKLREHLIEEGQVETRQIEEMLGTIDRVGYHDFNYTFVVMRDLKVPWVWLVLPPAFTPSNPPEKVRSFTTPEAAIDHLMVVTKDNGISPDDRENIIDDLRDGNTFHYDDNGWTIVRSDLDKED